MFGLLAGLGGLASGIGGIFAGNETKKAAKRNDALLTGLETKGTGYIDAALTLIRDRLTASLKVYLEFDNEPWNSAFLQYHWHLAATRAAVKGAINGPDGLAEIVSVARVGSTVTVTLSRSPFK